MPAVQNVQTRATQMVFIVDDDPDLCQAISAILTEAGHGCVVFDSAQGFLDTVAPDAAGCVLLDIRMPEITGPELQALMAERGYGLPIIFLTATADVRTAVGVLQRGAIDLIVKPFEPEELVKAVQAALAKDVAQRAELGELNELYRRVAELTPREREVADLLAQGNSNRETANFLGLSERTVEIHRSRIMTKMQCDSIVNFGIQWSKVRAAPTSDPPSNPQSNLPSNSPSNPSDRTPPAI
jgi:two-component system, LuxR family, response regulator FixJ